MNIEKNILTCLLFLLIRGSVSGQTLNLSTPTTGEYSSNVSITLSPGFSTSGPFHAYITSGINVPLASAPSQDQNYIRTKTYRVASPAEFPNPMVSQVSEVIQYFDGLGRPSQTIQTKGSPLGNDIVQPVAYDAFGRETVKYLPYAEQSGGGAYKTAAVSTQAQFYSSPGWDAAVAKTMVPYSKTVFEPSPLNRVLEQGAPGTIWQPAGQRTSASGRTVTASYAANDGSAAYSTSGYAVRLWNAMPVAGSNAMSLSSSGYYAAGQLFLKITSDENWTSADGKAGTTEEYTDKEEHVVLKRTFNRSDAGIEVLSTYYVYDDLGRLSFVLPPASGGDSGNVDQNALDNLCYQYRYDYRSRENEKKLPAKGWEFTAYNTFDQVVIAQDANQRNKTPQEWTFIKYDALGRAAMTGITVTGTADNNISSPNRSAFNDIQNFYSSAANSQWETRENSSSTGYTSVNNPTGNDHPFLTINYYDDYTFPGNPYPATASGTLSNVKGLLTGTKTVVLNPDGTYGPMLWTVHYYDSNDREIQTFQQHYLGGPASYSTNNYDEISNTYNFTGQITASVRHHYISTNTAAPALVTSTTFAYDHVGRKLQATKAVSNGNNPLPSPTTLSKNDYNEIGQLKNKSLDGGTQAIAYSYNERGWLRTMNSSMFNLDLRYDNPDAGVQQQWNGNISQMNYLTSKVTSPGVKSFSYAYDKLNRLKQANSSGSMLDEGIRYDLMGNITSLNRGSAGTLQYTYVGNQLSSVTGYSPRTYQYDMNGNATSDGMGRGISYNMLNLPAKVTVPGSSAILASYTYDAGGNKLNNNGSDGAWDYINGIVYHNHVVEFIITEEGRIKLNAGVFSYEYNLKDHLGNTRVSFDKYEGAARVIQEDEYYSFGLRKLVGGYDLSNNNRYLYNGKELQTDLSNQYDYGARFYDPVIGRWATVDPLAEKMTLYSPYSYAFNNPIRFIDVGGQIPYPITIRAFAPFATFGGGFKGDNRGYTTNNTTARVAQKLMFDTDKSSLTAVAYSSKSHYGSREGRAIPTQEISSFTGSTDGDARKFNIAAHVASGNPLTPSALTPDIDIFSSFSIESNAKSHTLSIIGKLTGDNFPSTEAFISDKDGNNVFLGIGQIGKDVSKNTGPLTELSGENKDNPITNFNLTITTDKDGNFTGVQSGGTKYSISDWNKRFTNKKPQQ